MPKFEEMVSKLLEGADSIGDVTEYVNELTAAHEDEISTRDAVISERDKELETVSNKLREQKLTNYDLIESMGVNGGGNNPNPSDPPAHPDRSEQGITSLFKPKEA